jgi:hypothetical protein
VCAPPCVLPRTHTAFSRRMVARIVFDQKIETWLRVHVEAVR